MADEEVSQRLSQLASVSRYKSRAVIKKRREGGGARVTARRDVTVKCVWLRTGPLDAVGLLGCELVCRFVEVFSTYKNTNRLDLRNCVV